MLQNNHAV